MFVKNFINYYFKKIFIRLFNVPRWHLSMLKDKKYAIEIINELNACNSNKTVVEIGCGMGDIIRNLNFRKKIGYDISTRVLFGALLLDILNFIINKFSSPGLTTFKKSNLENLKLHKKVDVIILVNWIHMLHQDKLNKCIVEIVKSNLNSNGFIVFDCLLNNKDYKFNHNHLDLIKNSGLKIYKILGPYNYNRFIYFYKK